jgi:hypothetical protein
VYAFSCLQQLFTRLPASGAQAMTRRAGVSAGSWPLEMRSETAAAYVDEPSVEAFLEKVRRGVYSEPVKQKGCLPKWHRHKLDRDVALRHGLAFNGVAPVEDASELI